MIHSNRSARIGAASRRLVARALVRRGLDLHVEGLEHVPVDGPVMLAARHYHHLYDACAILASVPRDVHILVAVDWLSGWPLSMMNVLTCAAQWPAVRRGAPWAGVNRAAYRLSLEVLRAGRVLLVFPEGYPVGRGAWLRFGTPIAECAQRPDRQRVLAEVETAVRTLSAAPGD